MKTGMRISFPHFGSGTLALKMFLEDLGAEVLEPPPPTKRTLELGTRYSPEQICLPFKITLGSMIETVGLGANMLFIAAGTRKCRFGYYHLLQNQILAQLGSDVRLFGLGQYAPQDFLLRFVPEIFGVSPRQAVRALVLLLGRSRLVHQLDNLVRALRPWDFSAAEELLSTGRSVVAATRNLADCQRAARTFVECAQKLTRRHRTVPEPGVMRIAVVGEIYLVLEPFANAELEKELGRLGVQVLTERSLYRHIRHLLYSDIGYLTTVFHARRYIGESPGGEVTKTIGEAVAYARQGVDGIIHVFPFTCMPENMALEIMQRIGADYNIPVMSLSFDEHTSRTGLITRLEAFVEMVTRRRGKMRFRKSA